MMIRLADWSRSQAMERPADGASSFGCLLRELRLASRVSQNEVARRAGCDPAHVNHLERRGTAPAVSRDLVRRLWLAVDGEADDLDDLLAAAGLLPESIVAAGGWGAYLRDWRGQVMTLERKLQLRDAAIIEQGRRLALREGCP